MKKRTLVIGASEKSERYSNKAVRALRLRGHEVIALAPRSGQIEDVTFETERKVFAGIDTVTLYIGPENQTNYIDYIIQLKPKRVIFNPGTENDEFIAKLNREMIKSEVACTLVLLNIGQY